MRFYAVSCASLLIAASSASGQGIITQWNFNTTTGVNNTPAPSIGTGSATPVGMTSNANNADILAAGGTPTSSDTAVPNSAWRVRGSVSNGWSGTQQLLSGARFNAPTTGFFDISISLDIYPTDGSPRHAQMQYTLDGTNFVSFGSLLDFNPLNDRWNNGLAFNLSSIAGANNNPNFGFQIVSAFSPVAFTNANGLQPANTAFQRANAGTQVYTGAAGNYRFDSVTFSGTVIPSPGAAVLLGLGGLMAARRRRPLAV
jgi:hypothetical protein